MSDRESRIDGKAVRMLDMFFGEKKLKDLGKHILEKNSIQRHMVVVEHSL